MRKNLMKKCLTYLLAIAVLLTSSGFINATPVNADVIETESSDTDVIESTSSDEELIETESDDTEAIDAEADNTDTNSDASGNTKIVESESSDADAADTETDDTNAIDGSQSANTGEATDASVDNATKETLGQEDTDTSEEPDGDYICTLQLEETNPMLRMVDNSSSLPISYSSYEVFWPGHGIMYVANDNKYADSMGSWRLVYCYDQGKSTPSGTLKFSGWSNKKVAYAMYYGTMYWGETCRYAPYSTGDWKLDAMATQSAIWVLSGQYTLDYVVDVIIDCCNGTATRAQRQAVEAATQKIVNDANKESNYTGWNSDGWFDLSLSGKSTFNISGYKNTWTDNGNGYYVSGGAFKTTFKSYYGYDMRSQITSFDVSVPDGVEVVTADSKTFSDFSLRISEDQYNEWKQTGKEIKVKVTMKIPRLWSAGLYKSSDDNYQRTTLLTYKTKSDTATFTKTITLTIPKEATPYGKLQIKKSSANTGITAGNSCYSLAGAEYTVYSDKNCTAEAGTLVTDEEGNTEALTLNTGTYYVRETSSPVSYLLDTKTYTVTITEDHLTTPCILKVKDKPEMALVDVLLKKVDADTNKDVTQNTATLEGAEFTVNYYDVPNSLVDPAGLGHTPVRTWVFATDADGCVYLDEDYLVSGDDLYLSDSGEAVIPIGTVTIFESKQPEGYLRNDEVFVIPITADGSESAVSYAAPVIPDEVFKLNLTKVEAGTGKVIPGAVFEHTRPNGEKETVTTDENGQLSFVGLEWGDHIIREVSVMDGYLVNETKLRFTVSEDNTVEIQSPSTLEGAGITLENPENSNIRVTVENELALYGLKILKKNEKGVPLTGAEFTLYADEDCTDVIQSKITGSDGSLTFEGLAAGQTLYCKETKAPTGYALPEEVVVYEIYVESSPVDGVFDFYVNGEKYTVNDTDEAGNVYVSGSFADRIVNLKVTNTAGMLLPETGSSMTLVLYLFGAALMTGVLITNDKKHVWRKSL